MSSKYKFHNPEGLYFISFAVQGWVDIFTRNEYKDILVDNLAFCQKQKGLVIFAWCIMTNHVHLMTRAERNYSLPEILRDFKKFSSKAIINAILKSDFEDRRNLLLEHFITPSGIRFWQPDNHPIELWSNEVITQKLYYLHQNPVEEGLAFRAEDYAYSSAIDYAGNSGMLEVTVIG